MSFHSPVVQQPVITSKKQLLTYLSNFHSKWDQQKKETETAFPLLFPLFLIRWEEKTRQLFLTMSISTSVCPFYWGKLSLKNMLRANLLLRWRSCFQNSGQICLCTSRVYVQRGIYQKFLDKFLPEVQWVVKTKKSNGRGERHRLENWKLAIRSMSKQNWGRSSVASTKRKSNDTSL